MKLVIDTSYYNIFTPEQWRIIKDFVDGFIVRLSYGVSKDSQAEKQINEIAKINKPFAGYHWVDPTWGLSSQLANVRRWGDYFKPKSLFSDYEQYWTDWAAYMAQNLAEAYRTRFSPLALQNYHSEYQKGLEAIMPDIPLGIYSADWYMDKYCPQMQSWVPRYNMYWEAKYVSYYDYGFYKEINPSVKLDPLDFRQKVLSHVQVEKGIGKQFTSVSRVKGMPENLDYNVFTDSGFNAIFNSEIIVPEPPLPPPPPPPTPPTALYKVKAYAAWIREEPMGLKVGYKLKGARVQVIEIIDAGVLGKWAKTPEGFMGMSTLELFINLV